MINELEEFLAYTTKPVYTSSGKRDSTYLGRFTFDMIMDFEGLGRVLTIIARGYLHNSGSNPYDKIDFAHRALCAWCSVPNIKKASPKKDWQFETDFRNYAEEFPELVDKKGKGWFYKHCHSIADFIRHNPDKVSKSATTKAVEIQKGFDEAWRQKVIQFQVPIFSTETKGAWIIRFDDIIADALELGPLRDDNISFSADEMQRIEAITPKGVPTKVMETLIAYYNANKPDDSDWVVFPITNFDAYFGTTSFGRKWLGAIPDSVFQRERQSFGVCRGRILY